MRFARFKGYFSASMMVMGIAATTAVTAQETWNGTLVQYGTMHEAIGQNKSEGRVELSAVTSKHHFYGIAALENLKGEITIFDSNPTVTEVGKDHALAAVDGSGRKATLLAGAYVPSWRECTVEAETPAAEFDGAIQNAAAKAGVDSSKPFVFTAEGEFTDVRLHVINGACPMHAKKQKVEIPKEKEPFEGEFAAVRGRIVGIYARDAVGKLTHPNTSTHVHLIFTDEKTGQTMTGHVERLGLPKGATLRLPA